MARKAKNVEGTEQAPKPAKAKRRTTFKAHLYSRELEWAVIKLSQSARAAEHKALTWLFANCMDDGITEAQFIAAYNDFSKDDAKKTLGIRYFRSYLKQHVEGAYKTSTQYSEAW